MVEIKMKIDVAADVNANVNAGGRENVHERFIRR